jgi:hypothetical protein
MAGARLAVAALFKVRTAMELEAYKQKHLEDGLLYTGHFIVVLQSTSRLSLAKIAIFNP